MEIRTVAVLFPGEMGHNVSAILLKYGLRVVTALEGRSESTAVRSRSVGITDLRTVDEVMRQADLVLCIVRPVAAADVAEAAAAAMTRTGCAPLYVDLNAKSPATSLEIRDMVSGAGADYVDGCIIGLSKQSVLELKSEAATRTLHSHVQTTLYVSGSSAETLLQLKTFGLNVVVIGEEVGQASAFKMLHAGVNKGRSALMIELLVTAHRAGVYGQVTDKYAVEFPEMVAWLEREMISTPFRALRRSDEMAELARFIEKLGISPDLSLACWKGLRLIGDMDLRSSYTEAEERGWTQEDVVRIISEHMVSPD